MCWPILFHSSPFECFFLFSNYSRGEERGARQLLKDLGSFLVHGAQPDGLHRRVALTNFPKQRDIYKKNSGEARRRRREKWSSNVLHFLNGLCPLFRQWRRRWWWCWWCLVFFMSVVVPSGVIHVRIAGDFARGIVDSRRHQEPTRRNHHW